MKYIIMCGSNVKEGWIKPRQLAQIRDEIVVERTIRLLHECGVPYKDIYITVSDMIAWEQFEYIKSINLVLHQGSGVWVNCFYDQLDDEPRCYLMGDVWFSYSAIYKIVEYEGTDIQFFASARYGPLKKKWAEPYAFKVWDVNRFFECVDTARKLYSKGELQRCISWELWQVIKGTELNVIDYTNYICIDDYSCDIDEHNDIHMIEDSLNFTFIMIHAVPERLWYVRGYLIPELERQGCCNITVWCDKDYKGNLESCFDSFISLPDGGFTVHIQDDVLPCEGFGERLKTMDHHWVYCGFASEYDDITCGGVSPKLMWLSFPCIVIPNKIAKQFAVWCKNLAVYDGKLRGYMREGKYDDNLFKEYMNKCHPNASVFNMCPNMVEHVDWLIGGSVVNKERVNQCVRSKYWIDEGEVGRLEEWLNGRDE